MEGWCPKRTCYNAGMLQFNCASSGSGEVVKGTDSSSRGTRLSSQHLYNVSQLVIITVAGN